MKSSVFLETIPGGPRRCEIERFSRDLGVELAWSFFVLHDLRHVFCLMSSWPTMQRHRRMLFKRESRREREKDIDLDDDQSLSSVLKRFLSVHGLTKSQRLMFLHSGKQLLSTVVSRMCATLVRC